LNHPNIATIHRLERSGGADYLEMELVPEEAPAQRLLKGPLPLTLCFDEASLES
jgi:hypothetical protein